MGLEVDASHAGDNSEGVVARRGNSRQLKDSTVILTSERQTLIDKGFSLVISDALEKTRMFSPAWDSRAIRRIVPIACHLDLGNQAPAILVAKQVTPGREGGHRNTGLLADLQKLNKSAVAACAVDADLDSVPPLGRKGGARQGESSKRYQRPLCPTFS